MLALCALSIAGSASGQDPLTIDDFEVGAFALVDAYPIGVTQGSNSVEQSGLPPEHVLGGVRYVSVRAWFGPAGFATGALYPTGDEEDDAALLTSDPSSGRVDFVYDGVANGGNGSQGALNLDLSGYSALRVEATGSASGISLRLYDSATSQSVGFSALWPGTRYLDLSGFWNVDLSDIRQLTLTIWAPNNVRLSDLSAVPAGTEIEDNPLDPFPSTTAGAMCQSAGIVQGWQGNLTPAADAGRVSIPDPSFVPVVDAPTYPHVTETALGVWARPGPVVGIDSTHGNFHSIDPQCPRYAAVQALLEADGATVVDFAVPFTSSCVQDRHSPWDPITECAYRRALRQIDILVIANPGPIGADEAEVIADWVAGDAACDNGCQRRGLIVVADGGPDNRLPLPHALGNELGVTWHFEDDGDWEREFTTCATGGGAQQPGELEEEHAVTNGMDPADVVLSVRSFTDWYDKNPALESPGADSLLTLRPGSKWAPGGFLGYPGISNAGLSTGLVFEHGDGRVYAGADADMFGAVIHPLRFFAFPPYGVYPVLPYHQGMQQWSPPGVGLGRDTHEPNQRFLLNLVHWMDGVLPDWPGGSNPARTACRWPGGPPL